MRKTWKSTSRLLPLSMLCVAALAGCAARHEAQETEASRASVETTAVVFQKLDRNLRLPGEILPYQDVPIYPKVSGFIQWIGVDRGSVVKKGQLLVKLVAPELSAQHSEAQQKEMAAQSAIAENNRRLEQATADKLEAESRLGIDTLTYKRMLEASQTPGTIAQNDLDTLRQTVEMDKSRVIARESVIKSVKAQVKASEDLMRRAQDAVKDIEDLQKYLLVTAPYDGVITERNMHEGSLAYPPSGSNGYPPMVRIKENSLLRIVVPVPEMATSGVVLGQPIEFTVSAYPAESFTGNVARIAHSLEPKTRTMPIELNYWNPKWKLSPGMFPEIIWPMRRNHATGFVPESAIVVTLEEPFVIKAVNGIAHRVSIVRGQTMNGLVEVFGNLKDGDTVVLHASDEIQEGAIIH